jgi:hypothetical protein
MQKPVFGIIASHWPGPDRSAIGTDAEQDSGDQLAEVRAAMAVLAARRWSGCWP